MSKFHSFLLCLCIALVPAAEAWGAKKQAKKLDPFQEAVAKLKSRDYSDRRSGAETLGRMRNPDAIDPLRKLLKDRKPSVRVAACDALGLLRAQAAALDIAKLLEKDKEPSVRQMAAVSLGYIADRRTIPSLIKGLKDSHDGTRFACVNSLGILRDESAIKVLTEELENPDPRMRSSVAYALGNIGGKEAIALLLDALKVARSTAMAGGLDREEDVNISVTIIRSLGMKGNLSNVSDLKPYLKDPNKKVKIHTAHALYRFGDDSGVPLARTLLADDDHYTRGISVEILGALGNAKDFKRIKKMAPDPNPTVQQKVQVSLEQLNSRYGPKRKRTRTSSKKSPAKKSR